MVEGDGLLYFTFSLLLSCYLIIPECLFCILSAPTASKYSVGSYVSCIVLVKGMAGSCSDTV